MVIKSAEIFHIVLPMKFSFVTGFGEIKERDAVIIKLESADGLIGWGESAALSAPVYLEETVETCIHILREFILPRLKNRNLEIDEFMTEIGFIRRNNLAKHGAETALWAIESQIKSESVSQLLGGSRKTVPLGESIGIMDDTNKLLGLVDKRLKEGYQRIKLKIKPGHDWELVKAVREKHPDILISVDANSSYTRDQISDLQRLDEFGLLMIEQPFAFDDIIDHAEAQKKLKTPICLDESITSSQDARKAIEIGACRIINVKPGRVGGLLETKRINEIAKNTGTKLWCGGMLETGIGKAYNIAAASLSEFSLPADITPSSTFFAEDITQPDLQLSRTGTVAVPQEPGLGFQVLSKTIDKYLVKKIKVF